MELSEVLLTKSGGETERQVYFVQSTGALDRAAEGLPRLALRFGLTVPLAPLWPGRARARNWRHFRSAATRCSACRLAAAGATRAVSRFYRRYRRDRQG